MWVLNLNRAFILPGALPPLDSYLFFFISFSFMYFFVASIA
jgi:hypothetical protein